MKASIAAAALALGLAVPAAAPADAQERIVVTGARIVDRIRGYVVPHVGVTRRADYLLRTLYVSCDTRDAAGRADELRRTLRGMLVQAGRDDAIELSRLVEISDDSPYGGDDADIIVAPFTEEVIAGSFEGGYRGRADTSYVRLLVKTPVSDGDTLESAARRLEAFVDGVDVVGRSALDLNDEDTLSVVDPEQYRGAIFEAMSEDANARIASLGDGYAARFEGLENPVAWFRSDVLDLKLFIPHHLSIVPADEE